MISYLPRELPMSMICYLPYKDLNKIRVPFSLTLRYINSFNSFLPYTVNEWNKLDPEIRRIDS